MSKSGRKLGHIVSKETRLKLSIAHTGKRQSKETIKKISNALKGKSKSDVHVKKVLETRSRLRISWKGDLAGKNAMHKWVEKIKGKPLCCELCGTTDKEKTYDWSNVDHTYKRNLEDYRRLCRSCHRKYDLKYLTKKP